MTELFIDPPPTVASSRTWAESVKRHGVLTVDARASVSQVWEAMRAASVEHAVVLEQGIPLGVVALSEIWVAWGLELAPAPRRQVLGLVTPAPCVSSDTSLPQLCRVLLRSRKGAAMVLDQRGRLTGLVTADDVLALLAQEDEPPC